MGRFGRKKRRVQNDSTADTAASTSSALNGRNHSSSPAVEEIATVTSKPEPVFHEPLHNLPDDASTLSSLLGEASAAVSGGAARLPDPRRTLLLLRHCAPRLSGTKLSGRLPGWCQFLSGALRAPRHQWCRDAVCRAVQVLVTEASRAEEAHRLLAGAPVSQLVAGLADSAEKATPASLAALHAVLLHFGRACGSMRTQLADHLFELFDSARPSLSLAACRCVALLPHTGPSGSAGAAYVAAWAAQVRGLVTCFHQHLDQLLDGIVEMQSCDVPEESLERPPPPLEEAEPIQARYRLARRLVAIATCIRFMLSSGTKQAVSVPVSALLEMVIRCEAAAAVTPPSAMEVRAARRCLDDVRTAVLQMLHSLVLCCGPSLLLRASLLNRVLVNAVQPAAEAAPASPAADAAHCQALRTLAAWLRVTGAGSGLQARAEDLVTTLTELVRPPQPAGLTLQTDDRPATPQTQTNGVASGGASSRKRKRKPAAGWLQPTEEGGSSGERAGRAWPRRCRAALHVLTQLVTALGPLLKVSEHKTLQTLAVGQLVEVQRCREAPPPPFGRAACRAGLYRLLVALVSDPHPSWPAPLQYAGPLLARGSTDTDPAVSSLCRSGLATVVRCLQPSHPSLFFPLDLGEYSQPPPAASPASEGKPDAMDQSEDESDTVEVKDMSPASSESSLAAANSGSSRSTNTSKSTVTPLSGRTAVTPGGQVTVTFGTRVTGGLPALAPMEGVRQAVAGPSGWGVTPTSSQKVSSLSVISNRAPVTTVTIADSESGSGGEQESSADEVDIADDEQGSVEMLDDAGFNVDEKASGKPSPVEDDDDVKILETTRSDAGAGDNGGDCDMAPDVAEMLKDFVAEDPEVE